jgi:hypothetical protein
MWVYSLIFLAVLAIELLIFFIHYEVETYEFKVFFLLLTLITGIASAVFGIEGYLQNRNKFTGQTSND